MGLMWSALSYIWPSSTVDNTPADPATGLTARQKEIIKTTWGLVRQTDMKKTAVAFFMKFFEVHPEYQQTFTAFADVPRDELPKNRSLRAHSINVLYTITLLVDSLDDLDVLVGNLKKIGVNHDKLGFVQKDFENLTVVFLDFLEGALGKSNFNQEARVAWSTAFKVINSIIGAELKSQSS